MLWPEFLQLLLRPTTGAGHAVGRQAAMARGSVRGRSGHQLQTDLFPAGGARLAPMRFSCWIGRTALDGYGIGAPLPVAQMRLARRSSSVATAVGWLAHGSLGGTAAEYAVDLWCADTAHPQLRAGGELLAAAVVLAAVSRGDSGVLAALMISARPPLDRPP